MPPVDLYLIQKFPEIFWYFSETLYFSMAAVPMPISKQVKVMIIIYLTLLDIDHDVLILMIM